MRFAALLLLLTLSSIAYAESTSIQEQVKTIKPEISGILGVESNLYESKSPNHSSNTSIYLVPGVRYKKNFKLSFPLIVEKELTQKKEVRLQKSDIILSYQSIELNKTFKLSPSLGFILPLPKELSENQSLQLGSKIALRLGYDLKTISLPILTGFLEASYLQNFHEYPIAVNGKSNTQRSISNWLSLDTTLLENLSLGTNFILSHGYTYKNNLKESFKWEESLDYEVSKNWTTSLSISNTGGMLKADGASSNLSLINEYSTTIGASVGFQY